jgi:hypothetical protein
MLRDVCFGGGLAVVCLSAQAGLEDRVDIDATNETAVAAAPQVTAERAPLAANLGRMDSQGRNLRDVAGVSVRWWTRPARTQIGVGVGTIGLVAPAGDVSATPGVLYNSMPTMTVGMRYNISGEAAVYADATSARSLASNATPDLYNTKVGMEWQPAKSRFGFEGRSLGIQLQSGYRMSLRVRSGGLGVYFRGKF